MDLCQSPKLARDLESYFELSPSVDKRIEILEYIQLLATAQKQQTDEVQNLLPVRVHFFIELILVWACVDPSCNHLAANQPELVNTRWGFGQIFLSETKKCGCGAPSFRLVICSECGSEYLIASRKKIHGGGTVLTDVYVNDEDFGELVDSDELGVDEVEHLKVEVSNDILIAPANMTTLAGDGLSRTRMDRAASLSAEGDFEFQYIARSDEKLICAGCEKNDRNNPRLFNKGFLGSPFLMGVVIPTIINNLPARRNHSFETANGKRLITFTDSRQGTARHAVKTQMDSERAYVRSKIYEKLLEAYHQSMSADPKIEEQVQDLINKGLSETDARNFISQMTGGLSKSSGGISWPEMKEFLADLSQIKRLAEEYYQKNPHIWKPP